jgi:GNAT superfamily N-acetyltransferase
MAKADVRVAKPQDAAEIARIQVDTWRAAYADLLPPDVLAGLDAKTAELSWLDTVEGGVASVYVATEGPWIVGFCTAGPAPAGEVALADGSMPADAATVGLVGTILVEPRWGRRGHGGRLLGAAATGLREAGSTRGISWVPEADTVSGRFFRRAGWAPDGTLRTLDTGAGTVRELRLTGTVELTLR